MPNIYAYKKQDFGGPQFKNPYKLHRDQNKSSKRIKVDVVLLFLSLCFWAYFLFFSPFFTLKMIIRAESDFKEKKLIDELLNNYFDSAYFFSLTKNNYFLFSETKLKKEFNNYFFIKNIEVQKKFPNQLVLHVGRTEPNFMLKMPYEIIFLDAGGMVLEKYSNSASSTLNFQNNFPVILTNQDDSINIQDKIFSQEFLNFIEKFYVLTAQQPYNFNIEYFEAKNITQTDGSLIARLKDLGALYLNTSLTPEQQLENFLVLYKEKIQPQNKQFEYVDLRFGDKVYYK